MPVAYRRSSSLPGAFDGHLFVDVCTGRRFWAKRAVLGQTGSLGLLAVFVAIPVQLPAAKT